MNLIKSVILGYFLFVMVTMIINYNPTPENRCLALRHEIIMLKEIKNLLIEDYVPDSLKEASRDASYNLMYAEPDGNDYWASRGTIHETEVYIQTCVPCVYIDSLLQVKEQELKELQEGIWGHVPFFSISPNPLEKLSQNAILRLG